MFAQPFEPPQFVWKFITLDRVAVGQINAGDANALNGRLDIARMVVAVAALSGSKDFAAQVLQAVEREAAQQLGPMLLRVEVDWL